MRRALSLLAILCIAGGVAWLLAPSARTGERASRTESTRVPESERTPQAGERPRRGSRRPDPLPASRCPAGLARCRAAQGRILFVEAVDPDGDGDLHVVIAGGGVSAPGITAVDVAPALRPRRDPRVGDRASAAGQVQRGSFGQSQIHAVEFHVRRSSAEH